MNSQSVNRENEIQDFCEKIEDKNKINEEENDSSKSSHENNETF